jgi:dinuclear metal center YbgI/SA1388 family protein
MRLEALVQYLDDYLQVRDTRDAPDALNGLQVSNRGEVTRVAAAVDLCHATVQLAAAQGANLLLVHHGLFWGGLRPLAGSMYRRVVGLLEHDIAVYASHLPLDRHPDVGNNAILARHLEVAVRGSFGVGDAQTIGVWGELDLPRDAFAARLADVLGTRARALAFGPDRVRRVGIVTGAGGSLIPQAAAAGLDTYVTGEGAHWTYFDAEELRLNVYYGGHYLTETFGVRALAEHIGERFSLPWTFLDHPTGL